MFYRILDFSAYRVYSKGGAFGLLMKDDKIDYIHQHNRGVVGVTYAGLWDPCFEVKELYFVFRSRLLFCFKLISHYSI
jgi:hypothetical protein